MKKILVLLPLFLMVLLLNDLQAQAPVNEASEVAAPLSKRDKAEAESKKLVEKVLTYANARNYSGMSRVTVYAGRDPNRTMKAKINMNDPHEKLECENNLNYMHHVLEKSVIWNATNFRLVNALNDTYCYWNVEFTDEKMKTMVYQMLIVEMGNEYLFANFEKVGKLK